MIILQVVVKRFSNLKLFSWNSTYHIDKQSRNNGLCKDNRQHLCEFKVWHLTQRIHLQNDMLKVIDDELQPYNGN